jgi:hypothetical protein
MEVTRAVPVKRVSERRSVGSVIICSFRSPDADLCAFVRGSGVAGSTVPGWPGAAEFADKEDFSKGFVTTLAEAAGMPVRSSAMLDL